MGKNCQINNEGFFSRFSKCKLEPVGLCQYCGREFCKDHGEITDDKQEICSRRNCVAKRDDLVIHLKFKELAAGRNAQSECGAPGCKQQPEGQCAGCRAYYCYRHLESRHDVTGEGRGRVARMMTFCAHCWQRRPIWSRR